MPLVSKLLGAACLLFASQCDAAYTCTVNIVSGINFSYDPSQINPSSGVGKIGIACQLLGALAETASYHILISQGASGSFAQRQLKNGSIKLSYNLYKDSAHTQIWGDNTGAYSGLADSYSLSVGTVSKDYNVYLLSVPNQQVSAGSYSDTLFVTVMF